jgi:hypothetical protein
MLKHGVEKQTKTGCSQIFPIGSSITIRWIEEGLKHFEERRNFPKLNIFFYSKWTRTSFISMLYSNWNSITQKCQNKGSTCIQSRIVTKKKGVQKIVCSLMYPAESAVTIRWNEENFVAFWRKQKLFGSENSDLLKMPLSFY